jgi:hypothetical protein
MYRSISRYISIYYVLFRMSLLKNKLQSKETKMHQYSFNYFSRRYGPWTSKSLSLSEHTFKPHPENERGEVAVIPLGPNNSHDIIVEESVAQGRVTFVSALVLRDKR